MAELKTKVTRASVTKFIKGIKDEHARRDSTTLVRIMKKISSEPPRMWGPSIIGFGNYHYIYGSGREGDWFPIGFSPRKNDLTIYILGGFKSSSPSFKKLGKFKTRGCCLYIRKLSDVSVPQLTAIVAKGYRTPIAQRA